MSVTVGRLKRSAVKRLDTMPFSNHVRKPWLQAFLGQWRKLSKNVVFLLRNVLSAGWDFT